MLVHMSAQITPLILAFTKIDLTLCSYCSSIFWLRHLSDQTGICTGQPQKCSENVRSPTVISCSVLHYITEILTYLPSSLYNRPIARNFNWVVLLYNLKSVADLGGARGAVAPPPHLVSQDIQRDGCVVIKTHKNTNSCK